MKNIVSSKFVPAINNNNLAPQQGTFDGSPETTRSSANNQNVHSSAYSLILVDFLLTTFIQEIPQLLLFKTAVAEAICLFQPEFLRVGGWVYGTISLLFGLETYCIETWGRSIKFKTRTFKQVFEDSFGLRVPARLYSNFEIIVCGWSTGRDRPRIPKTLTFHKHLHNRLDPHLC